ncbi:MAG TPA: type II CRISPR-associated endonuclease Cas1 [Lacibacter sp.]|nr:type II CRISPR-associated endonuclease Cas1 [Lacibacter sp.]HMO87620.1 type II CRISPR-associated endonuclease Cas1 [Lacibacter sp.]
MIKRTLYFGNPAHLKTINQQLVAEFPETNDQKSFPIEDIGVLIADHQQITFSQALLARLLESNVAFITCDATHHPAGLLLNLEGNTLQSQKTQYQLDASVPLKKQLWQQTVTAKIKNQAAVLAGLRQPVNYLLQLADAVKSGDTDNHEAKAAAYYWKRIFPDFLEFKRERYGPPPNNLLNYGYAILRAIVARSLVGSGLMPTVGIHHKSQYNAFCLADDIMEPYRPYVDGVVCNIVRNNGNFLELTTSMKKELLALPAMDVQLEGKTSPLMIAVSRTTASLVKCFEGEARKIIYPEIPRP